MNRRQLLQTSAFAVPALALPGRNLFAEKIAPPPSGGFEKFSTAVAEGYQSAIVPSMASLLNSQATQAQLGALSNAHSTWCTELTNANYTSAINAAITQNASAISSFNPATYSPNRATVAVVQKFCGSLTESVLTNSIQGWNSANASTMISQGVAPQMQAMLQTIQALASAASEGPVGYRRQRPSAAHYMTADYRGSGGAHYEEVGVWGALAGISAGIFTVAAIFAPEMVVVAFAGYELTLAGCCALMAGVEAIVAGVDELEGY